jgi:nitric oxide reductase large subunit
MHLDLEDIVISVILLYIKIGSILFTHFFAKSYTAKKRSSPKPPFSEKLFLYASCIVITAVIGFAASVHLHDRNRGAVVFIALLIPALVGVADGLTTTDKKYTSASKCSNDKME